jgi:hypothetical protein
MRKLFLAVFSLMAGVAWAQDGNETKTEDDNKVDLRVSVLEVIDVTAEKTPAASADEPDADIDAILDEAAALEEKEALE